MTVMEQEMQPNITLTDLINEYRRASAEFEAMSDADIDRYVGEHEDAASVTFIPPLNALRSWNTPATTKTEAKLAVALANEFDEVYEDEIASSSLRRAAKIYAC